MFILSVAFDVLGWAWQLCQNTFLLFFASPPCGAQQCCQVPDPAQELERWLIAGVGLKSEEEHKAGRQ